MTKEAYIVHKEGEPDTLLLSANGRITTEMFDRPAWCPEGAAIALLARRNDFYQTRLGTELATPLLDTNIVNVLDLDWVTVDEEGEEQVIAADEEYRMGVLATALGVDREEGLIAAAITDHYLDQDGHGYTAEQIAASQQDAEAKFARKAV